MKYVHWDTVVHAWRTTAELTCPVCGIPDVCIPTASRPIMGKRPKRVMCAHCGAVFTWGEGLAGNYGKRA